MTPATSDRADRLRRSLRRLGYDLNAGERRGRFYITREGSKVDATSGLDLAGVEAWIRECGRDGKGRAECYPPEPDATQPLRVEP